MVKDLNIKLPPIEDFKAVGRMVPLPKAYGMATSNASIEFITELLRSNMHISTRHIVGKIAVHISILICTTDNEDMKHFNRQEVMAFIGTNTKPLLAAVEQILSVVRANECKRVLIEAVELSGRK